MLDRFIRLIEPMISGAGGIDAAAVQARGHARRVYRPLGVYSQLLLAEASGERPAELLRATGGLDDSVWSCLARRVGGELFGVGEWIESAAERFAGLVGQQQVSGEFLAADPRAHPETRWYGELTLLGAAASYAVRVPGEGIWQAVSRSALFHLNETQPDHATSEPWGLPAFAVFAPSMADQMLHGIAMQSDGRGAGEIGGPALLLLADALYALRRLLRNGA